MTIFIIFLFILILMFIICYLNQTKLSHKIGKFYNENILRSWQSVILKYICFFNWIYLCNIDILYNTLYTYIDIHILYIIFYMLTSYKMKFIISKSLFWWLNKTWIYIFFINLYNTLELYQLLKNHQKYPELIYQFSKISHIIRF